MFTTAGAARRTASAYVTRAGTAATAGSTVGSVPDDCGRTRSGHSVAIRNAAASPAITDPTTNFSPRAQLLFVIFGYLSSAGGLWSFVYNAPPHAPRKLQTRVERVREPLSGRF